MTREETIKYLKEAGTRHGAARSLSGIARRGRRLDDLSTSELLELASKVRDNIAANLRNSLPR